MCNGSWLYYSTPKVVVVRDKFLGFLRLFLLAPVVVYIVYAIFVEGRHYMKTVKPDGMVLVDVSRSSSLTTTLSSLSYCTSGTSTVSQLPCINVDGTDVLYRSGNTREIFIATRYSSYDQTYQCTFSTECTSPWTTTATGDEYYAGAVEELDLSLYHYAQATEFLSRPNNVGSKYSTTSIDSRGVLYDTYGTEIAEFEANGSADVMTLSQLLLAGGVTLDDVSTTVDDVTLRYTGLVAVLFISYSNTDNLEKAPRYNYRVRIMSDRDFLSQAAETTVTTSDSQQRTVLERSGVKLIILQVGTIGKFDFPTLFVYMASALALLLMSTLCIDFIMLCVLPRRRLYSKMKYEDVADLDHLDRKIKILERNAKGSLLTREQRESVAFEIVREESDTRATPLERELLVDSEVNDRFAEHLRLKLLFGGVHTGSTEVLDHELELLYKAFSNEHSTVSKEDLPSIFQSLAIPYPKETEERCDALLARMRARRLAMAKNSGTAMEDIGEAATIRREDFILLMKTFVLDFGPRVSILLNDLASSKDAEYQRDTEFLMSQFRELDTDDDGLLDYPQISKFLSDQDIKLSPREFAALMAAIDRDHDGKLTCEEFCVVKMFLKVVMDGSYLSAEVSGAAPPGANVSAAVTTSPTLVQNTTTTNVTNKLNSVNWNGVRSQFRALTAYINGLRDELRELTLITRMLQRRVIPGTLENLADHEPVHLAGDWNGETSDECRIT